MIDKCLDKKINVESRSKDGRFYYVYVCINMECKKKCDRERLPTVKERSEFNG